MMSADHGAMVVRLARSYLPLLGIHENRWRGGTWWKSDLAVSASHHAGDQHYEANGAQPIQAQLYGCNGLAAVGWTRIEYGQYGGDQLHLYAPVGDLHYAHALYARSHEAQARQNQQYGSPNHNSGPHGSPVLVGGISIRRPFWTGAVETVVCNLGFHSVPAVPRRPHRRPLTEPRFCLLVCIVGCNTLVT